MKDIFNILTERRIQEAIARGDFKNLPGIGKPLRIENLYFLPKKIRAAYIVLKNSGYLDQAAQENDGLSPSTDDVLCVPDDLHLISKQELSEKVFNHNVMMDCKCRR